MAYNGKMTWEVEETLAIVPVNDTNKLVVDVNRSSTGLVSIGVREFWTPDGENWYPGKKGIALKPEQWAAFTVQIQDWLDNDDNAGVIGNGNGDEARPGGRKLPVTGKRVRSANAPAKKTAPKAKVG